MGLIIRYENGLRIHALLLGANDQKMRVAIPFDGDTVELLRAGESWKTECGDAVEIDAVIQIPGVEASNLLEAMHPRAMAAGASFWEF